jgi:hypothetical protein
MHTYALFDNGTAELVIIKLLNVEVKETLNIYFQSFRSPKVKESARRGIECAYEIIFSRDIKAYVQKSPISITVKDFTQQVDGSSAGLAYSVAFASVLEKEKIIETPFDLPEIIAATGEIDIRGNVKKIKSLKEKILGAINKNAGLMFYPSQNSEELRMLLEQDKEFHLAVKNSGIQLKHVANIRELFCEMGILPETYLQEGYFSPEYPNRSMTEDEHSYNLDIAAEKVREIRKSKKVNIKNSNMIKVPMIILAVLIIFIQVYRTLEPSAESVSVNLALKKMVYASSDENSINSSANAFDGKKGTRWSSEHSYQQWIYVDLGSLESVSSVVLRWGEAYAKQYQILVSNDSFAWAVVYTRSNNAGGVNVINFDTVRARYVKMYAWQMATKNGYSLWEFEVYSKKQNVPAKASVSKSSKSYAVTDTQPS